MIRVAVTSVGGGVGQSVVDSISHLSNCYWILGLDISDNIFARTQCDRFVKSLRISEPNYLDFLLEICISNNIDVLIPGNDTELYLLSCNKELFSNNGIKVIVAPSDIVASSRDKYLWYVDYSDKFDIVATVKLDQYMVDPESFSDITFPAIAKPSGGSASSGIKIFHSLIDVFKDCEHIDVAQYVIQPYLFPKSSDPEFKRLNKAVNEKRLEQASEISVQIVLSPLSKILGLFVSKNRLKDGVPIQVEPINTPEILDKVKDIAEFLSLKKVIGPVNIQGRLTEKGLIFFEMNLRFTGITGNRSLFGFNEVSTLIDEFSGHSDTQSAPLYFNQDKIGVRQVACRTNFSRLDNRGNKRILVVGVNSWFSKNYLNQLAVSESSEKIELLLSSRNVDGAKSFYDDEFTSHFESVSFLDCSEKSLLSAVNYADVLVNFASARPPHGNHRIYESTLFNIKLAEMIKGSSLNIVINISSQSVYGNNSPESYSENDNIDIQSCYSMSKATIEEAFREIRTNNKYTKVVNLRVGRLWGGTLDILQDQIPFRILDNLLKGSDFSYQKPDNIINFIDVDDASYAISFIIEHHANGAFDSMPEVFNVGGHNITMQEYVTTLVKLLSSSDISIVTPDFIESTLEISNLAISTDKLKCLGWVPKSSIEDTWRKAINLFKEL
jgi:nucleoside-diphosphate-sugar epimerase